MSCGVCSLWEFVEVLLERLVALPADVDYDDVAALVDACADDTAVRVRLGTGRGRCEIDFFSFKSDAKV